MTTKQVDQLLQVLMPYPIIMQIEQLREKRTHSQVQVKLTHRAVQFSSSSITLSVQYPSIFAMHIESQDEFTLIIQDPEIQNNKKIQSQLIQVRSPLAPHLLNSIQYRQNIFQIWYRRLRYGVIKEALKYPLMLCQLNSNRSIFGQLSLNQLLQLSDLMKEQPYRCPDQYYGHFTPESLLDRFEGWKPEWPWKSNQSSESEQTIQFAPTLQQMNAVKSDLTLNAPDLNAPETFETYYDRSRKLRNKLQLMTGQTEQMRLKAAADQAQLSSPKLFQRQQNIQRWFNPLSAKYETFQEACFDLRDQLDPIRNTVLRDNKKLLQSLQLVKEVEQDNLELLDPVSLHDVASLSVEQNIFGSVFPKLWRRAKKEFKENDLNIKKACQFFRNEDNINQLIEYRGIDVLEQYLEIPVKYRDPCRYNLCVEEMKQLDQPLNMHPRQFLNALLETVICIQITVNTQTPTGLEQQRKMIENHQKSYNVSFGADDMLPIFIYVLIQADLKHAATASAIMEFCCDPSMLNDEYGYYLTCFQSAIDFVVRRYNDVTLLNESTGKTTTQESNPPATE
ncbi:Vacuolar_sorting protein [Hexamita inflata]|uniref:Vacuolar sorting protein n=1 Tax=Hexamita inflata TaxID=28002 RepID=A0AA86PD43_9EUKA|nr:Vacuolar sorting protein [Hexamita inflata]